MSSMPGQKQQSGHRAGQGRQPLRLRGIPGKNPAMSFMKTITVPAILVACATAAAAQQPPTRGIVNITGQLYRAQNNNHYTVFLVTPEGIIMSDPINRDFARWLKAEIATRFKVPVRYVLYTHRDWDHASGGVVFADTAEFVGHRNMLTALAPPAGNPPLAEARVKMDANRNGLVERSEATGAIAERFAAVRLQPRRRAERRRDRARLGQRRAIRRRSPTPIATP